MQFTSGPLVGERYRDGMLQTFPLRLGQAVAAGRVAIGAGALIAPTALARPWIGPAASLPEARVLSRVMGGRDLALGLGALRALSGAPTEARVWIGLGGMADAIDAGVTILAFRRLPRITRWAILASTAGAAIVSFRVAEALSQDPTPGHYRSSPGPASPLTSEERATPPLV